MLAFIPALGLGVPIHAQTASANLESAEPGLTITVRIYNYAHVATAQLARAEEEATAILHRAGVETAWVDCPLSGAELDRFPACQERTDGADFALRILSPAMTGKAPARGEALGFALPCPDDLVGCYADVFYQRVTEWAAGAEVSAYQLLGHAMAHEIGHLLLGPNSHSRDGVMRPQWSPKDLTVIARASLRFTPEQGNRIRAVVQGRRRQRELATGGRQAAPK